MPATSTAPSHIETFLAFLNSTGGQVALVLFFFLLIVFFLRRLFGPRGWLRDPHWDEMNRALRRQEQEAAMLRRLRQLEPLLERERAAFGRYVDVFCRNGQAETAETAGQPEQAKPAGQDGRPERAAMYELKREHSLNVLDNALEILAAEPALFPAGLPGAVKSSQSGRPAQPDQSGRSIPGRSASRGAPRGLILRKGLREPDAVLLLAALYHDLGRFEQLRRYGTFRDAESLNHGRLSAQLLKDPRFLAGESRETRALTRLAVLMHNRRELPAGLAPDLRPLCLALRDADKLDILRVMAFELAPGHAPDRTVVLGLADEPEKYSPALLEQACKREVINYTDMRWVNDLRFMLCGWLDSLAFASSRRILARRGHLENIMAALPDTPEIIRLTARVRSDLDAAK